jgi:outer membrane lipoprotein SlyB
MKLKLYGLAPVLVAVGLSGCAGNQPYSSSYPAADGTYSSQGTYPSSQSQVGYGYVDRIEVVPKGASRNVAGTVIGGIVGGLIGSQIGSGSGRTAAVIAGAGAGAVAGNVIEGRRRADNEAFRVSVRLDNGSYQTVMQEDLNDLQTGDRVRVDGNRVTRV